MKRILIGLAIGAIGGTLFGFALGIFVYPFWFLRDLAMEQLTDVENRTEIARGQFAHVNAADPVHWGDPPPRFVPFVSLDHARLSCSPMLDHPAGDFPGLVLRAALWPLSNFAA
jgi:hypothetical protein